MGVHCDYNEFNLMVTEEYDLFVIDFPQMISINHKQGIAYFDRDVLCIVNYFKNKHDFEIPADEIPKIDADFLENEIIDHLYQVIEASGYYGKNEQIHMDEFETLHKWFGSTMCQRLKDEELNDDKKEDEDDENESVDEKELWKLKKMKKKQAFQQRRLLKKAIAEHKESVLNDDVKEKCVKTDGVNDGMENGTKTLSETEIRKRLKKKQKQEMRKNKYKRARKASDNNKARRDMKREMASNFW